MAGVRVCGRTAARVGEGAPAPGSAVRKHEAARIGRQAHEVTPTGGTVQEAFSSRRGGACSRFGIQFSIWWFLFRSHDDINRKSDFGDDYFGLVRSLVYYLMLNLLIGRVFGWEAMDAGWKSGCEMEAICWLVRYYSQLKIINVEGLWRYLSHERIRRNMLWNPWLHRVSGHVFDLTCSVLSLTVTGILPTNVGSALCNGHENRCCSIFTYHECMTALKKEERKWDVYCSSSPPYVEHGVELLFIISYLRWVYVQVSKLDLRYREKSVYENKKYN
jgi:hypothetical protein